MSFLLFCGFSAMLLFFFIKPYYSFITDTVQVSLLKTFFSLDSLKTYNNNVTILILGIAGEDHEGTNLSDSMIVVNYNLKSNKLLNISLPRDIWSDTLKDKINTAYTYGEIKQKGGGLILAKAEAAAVIGRPIHYSAVINFSQFEELIDFLGGIDIEVDNSFVDKKYPVKGRENDDCGGDPEYSCRYESVEFKRGMTKMDGKTALIYVRSRNAKGSEGNDFARNKRQQKVISAVKSKIINRIKTVDLGYIKRMYQILDRIFIRDIENQQIAVLVKNYLMSKNFRQVQISLSQEFFTVPNPNVYYGKYVLIPIGENFSLIKKYIDCHQEKLEESRPAGSCEILKNEGEKNDDG